MAEFIIKNRFVSVPETFITDIMPSANGAYVKVYLYALASASAQRPADTRSIATALNLIESDVVNALEYFRKAGALSYDGTNYSFNALPAASGAVKEPFSFMDTVGEPSAVKKSYTTGEVSANLHRNKDLSDMITMAQKMLGRTLNSNDTQTLYWFYDGLGLKPEIILMIIEYCLGEGKSNMPFIEKVAIEWHGRGINTVEDAVKYTSYKSDSNAYSSSLKKIMGITDRKLVPKEEEFLRAWREDLNMKEDMVALAYEYCILQINKLSFAYMDKILRRWHSQGIFTIAEAEEDDRRYREERRRPDPSDSENDLYSANPEQGELDRMMIEKYNS